MTTLTGITACLMVLGVLSRLGYSRALALGGVTASGVALVVGGNPLPTFYAVAIGAAVLLVIDLLVRGRDARPTVPLSAPVVLLMVFLVWATVVTLSAPLLFAGLEVPVASGGTRRLMPGLLTSSNIAQIAYLLLGVAVVVFVSRDRRAGPELIGLVVGPATVLSFWRYLSLQWGLPFPERFFDNSPTQVFIETAAGGQVRFRGIFSEPAGLAGMCLVAVAYMIVRQAQLSGWRRIGAWAVIALATFMGFESTSTTFVLAIVALVGIAGGSVLFTFLGRRLTVRRVISVVACLALIPALWLLPPIVDDIAARLVSKVDSSSYVDRSAVNNLAGNIFLDTFGFGAGLGSVRASSLAATAVASTGVIGTVLFAVAIGVCLFRGWADPRLRPVVWALIALLVGKLISGPDIADPSGVTWLALGLLAGVSRAGPGPESDGAVRRRTRERPAPSLGVGTPA